MASQLEAPHGGTEFSIQVQSAPAVHSVLRRRRKSAAAKEERRLNGFVRFVALGEWAGNSFGTLAFLWATVVLLGAFCKDLESEDFGYAAAMVFIEAFRIFSRNYRLDDQSLFMTTRAISAVSSPFVRMLARPQEWNELAAIIGLSTYLITPVIQWLPSWASMVAFIIFIKLQFPGALWIMKRPRRQRRLLLWAVLAVLLLVAGLHIQVLQKYRAAQPQDRKRKVVLLHYAPDVVLWCAVQLIAITPQVVSVLLLNLRPPRIASLINSPCGRKLLTLAKMVLAIYLLGCVVLSGLTSISPALIAYKYLEHVFYVLTYLSVVGFSFATVVLSLGSLQTPSNSPSTCWIEITLHICFFCQLASSLSFIAAGLTMLAVLLIGNLQIPAAIARIVLSSLSLGSLAHPAELPPQYSKERHLVPSLVVFYVLTLCQGTLYLGEWFFRRRLRGKASWQTSDLGGHQDSCSDMPPPCSS